MARRADRTFEVTLRAVSVTALALSVGAFVRSGGGAAASTLVGGAVAVANLMAMRQILGGVIDSTTEGDLNKGRRWGTLAVLKLFGLFAVVAIVLIRRWAAPLPFVVGYVSLPVGIAVGALLTRHDGDDTTNE